MRKVLIFSILNIGLLFTSCEKEEACLAPDIAGIYTGTKECDEMVPVSVTFQVTPGDSDIHLIIDGIATSIDECDIYGSTIVQGAGRDRCQVRLPQG